MKNFFKIMLLALSVAFFGMAFMSSPDFFSSSGDEIAAALAVAPLAFAAFSPDNLKISMPEFEQLKARYGKLYVVDVNIDEDEKYQFYVCRPTRDLLSAIASNKDDLNKANNMILKNMVVGGDMDALDDGVVYAALMANIAKIIKQGTSFLSKA